MQVLLWVEAYRVTCAFFLIKRVEDIVFMKFSVVSRLNHLRGKKSAKCEIPQPTSTQANSDKRFWNFNYKFKKFSKLSRLKHLRSKKFAKREIPPATSTQANSDERVWIFYYKKILRGILGDKYFWSWFLLNRSMNNGARLHLLSFRYLPGTEK